VSASRTCGLRHVGGGRVTEISHGLGGVGGVDVGLGVWTSYPGSTDEICTKHHVSPLRDL